MPFFAASVVLSVPTQGRTALPFQPFGAQNHFVRRYASTFSTAYFATELETS